MSGNYANGEPTPETVDSRSNASEAGSPGARCSWIQRGILGLVCIVVVGIYVCAAHPGIPASGTLSPADDYYSLLVQGFRDGQLSLKKGVPPGFRQLADPYDPTENALYRYPPYALYDLSYYKGKLYVYFGAIPAVLLFWPCVQLTGHYLPQKDSVVIFCLVGFLAGAGLRRALWRRYFADVNLAVVAAGTLALGLVNLTPFLLARCSVYEVAISCGYALTMLALAAIWKALHESERSCRWLAAASLAYGLAVGARPSLLFGAVILFVPVVQAWRIGGPPFRAATATAVVPIALIGLGLMLYNALRFDSPLEFGLRYQLAGERHFASEFFRLRYLWFNFRAYFLEPPRWTGRFPFVHDFALAPAPTGHIGVDKPFGALTNIPLVWLALAVPLAWRGRSAETRSILAECLAAIAMLFGVGALTLGLFFYTAGRYELDFLPALVLLAVVGIFGLERAVAPTPKGIQGDPPESGQADRAVWRHVLCWGWGLLLVFSLAFNLLACVGQCADSDYNLGVASIRLGKVQEAIGHYERALRLNPDFAGAHNNLGIALMARGRLPEAIGQYEQALRLRADYAEPHYNLGVALAQAGQVQEAIGHWEQALRIKADYAEAHNNLGIALMTQGRLPEAIGHYEQALRINPDYAPAQCNWANALFRQGRVPEAIGHYELALRINPDFAEARFNLGVALEKMGRTPEAVQQYEQALRIKPDFVQARNALARARAGRRNVERGARSETE